jgi:hypothetical protein
VFGPTVEYTDIEVTLPPPVKKQVWNGYEFVPMTLYRQPGLVNNEQQTWLTESFGPPGTYINGRYWDHSRAGSFTVMDERVYTWFRLKWGKK